MKLLSHITNIFKRLNEINVSVPGFKTHIICMGQGLKAGNRRWNNRQ